MGRIDFTKLDTYRRVFDGFLQIKGVVDGYTNLPITASDGDIYKDKISGRLYSKSGEKWLVSGMTEDDIKLFSPEVYVKLSDATTPKTNVLYLIGPTGTGEDKYEEYIYNGTEFVKIGDTSLDISSKQDKLVSGENIKTINNASLLGDGNIEIKSGAPYIIKATQLGSTGGMIGDITITSSSGIEAYNEAYKALSEGRDALLAITQLNTGRERIYRAWGWKSSNNNINFQAAISNYLVSYTISSNGTVSNGCVGGYYETTSNLVTSLSSTNTDTQYPSAKAVYDAVSAATAHSMTYNEMVTIWDATYPQS